MGLLGLGLVHLGCLLRKWRYLLPNLGQHIILPLNVSHDVLEIVSQPVELVFHTLLEFLLRLIGGLS